jgi:hypothetical protein
MSGIDPRESLLSLYEAWVRVPPHHPGRRALVDGAIRRCKAAIAAWGPRAPGTLLLTPMTYDRSPRAWVTGIGLNQPVTTCSDCGAELTQPLGQEPWPCGHCCD